MTPIHQSLFARRGWVAARGNLRVGARWSCAPLSLGLALLAIGPAPTSADVVNLTAAADTFIVSSNPDNNAGALGWIDAGTDGVGGIRRGLLRFDLGSIPAGATITSAVVQLTVIKVPFTGAVNSTFDLSRLGVAWGEGTKIGNNGSPATPGEATWNARIVGTATWTVAGAKSDAAATASASVAVGSTANTTYSWSSSSLVNDAQFWLDNPTQNFGWLLTSQGEASSRSVRGFASRESGATAGTLQIGFVPPPLTTTNVDIVNFAFSPRTVTIKVGDTVTWTERDGAGHSTTSDTGVWDSGSLPLNGTFSFTFNTAGTYPYHCTPHPFMTGTVIVLGTGNSPPTVTITNPASGAVLPAGVPVSIEATATDSDGTVTNVEFFDDSTSLGSASATPYSVTANLAAGGHSLTAVATDNLGASSTSAVVTVTVQAPNTPPTVAITNPTNGASFTAPASVLIEATADDPDGVMSVEFFDGATSLGMAMATPYNVNANLAVGGHSLTAAATDNLGASRTSAVVTVTVGTVPIDNPIADRIPKGEITIELKTVADGMVSPLGMAVPDDGSGRMFVYDQAGVVWVVTAAGRLPTPLLDVRTRLPNISGAYDERGLLGLAVHTNFAQNPLLYTYTSEPNAGAADFPSALPPGVTNDHQSVIAEWRLNPSSTNRVDPATRREVLRIDEPQANHNGGTMRFGPDGLLYISVGDGGAADDQGDGHSPGGNGQDTNNILGSVIRIDVDGRNSSNGQYGVPADNPFVGGPGVDEIYAYGLRNPFNFSFDRVTGQLYLGDVGQNKVEEIDLIQKGANYGWNVKEGTFFFDPNGAGAGYVTAVPVRPVPPDLVDPIAEYDHDDGSAVIGGYVYRGSQVPGLAGRYVFGDWGVFGAPSGRLFYLDANSAIKELRLGVDDRPLGLYVKGFGEDAAGELYVFASEPQGPSGIGGVMHKIVPPATALGLARGTVSDGTNFQTAWTGGTGPFAQQRKASLDEPVWMNEAFVTNTTVTAPIREAAGFFRETDTARQPAVPFTALLNGANERPDPITTAGAGFGVFSLEGNSLTFSIGYRGLGGPATGAHIHGPSAATNSASVLINLVPYAVGPLDTNGTFAGTVVLTDAQKAYVMAGQTYANVHTSANSNGEIRGHIAPVLLHASLLGAYENPAVQTRASGLGSFMLVGNQLTFNIAYRGLSGPANGAHIHLPAPLGRDAGVSIGLAPYNGGAFGSSGLVSGSVILDAGQLAAVIDGQSYVNFHTGTHSGGEIRGQILSKSTAVPFTAFISGLNERPVAFTNTAAGLGLFSLEGNTLAFNITYSGLSGPATAAHIHGPADTSGSTGVQIDLQQFHLGPFNTNGTFAGAVVLTPAQRSMILNGLAYFNIHTADKLGGEARGQLAPVLLSAAASGPSEQPRPIVSAGSALGLFALVGTQLNFNVAYGGLSGPATGGHIHAPADASQTASVVINFSPFNGGAFGSFGSVTGATNLTANLLDNLIDGLGYVNFHTATHSGGEIRGQVLR